jgi:hypothetical protein
MSISATGIPTPSPAARAVEEEVKLFEVSVGVEAAVVDCDAKVAASIVEAEVC